MAAHRYWRLLDRINSGGSFTGISELELRTSAGGADQTGSGTPLGSGSIQAGSLAAVFDNSTSTGVQYSGTGAGIFVGYDFGSGNDKDIIEINVLPRHDGANRTFGEFDVQSSDDNSTWTTQWSCTYTAWVIGTTVTFTKPTAIAHRYWRVRLTGNYLLSSAVYGLAEMEMKDVVGGTDLCTGGTASARSTAGGFPASNVFADDGGTTIYSSSGNLSSGEWIRYDFGSGNDKDIIEVTMLGRNDTSLWMQMPRSAIVESSPDATSFLPRWSYTQVVGDRTYTQRRIKPANVPAAAVAGRHRFWGIKVNAVQNPADVWGCASFDLRSSVGGSTILAGGAPCVKFPWTGGGTPATNVLDGNTGTDYSGNVVNGGGDILAYDFTVGSEVAVPAEIFIRARDASEFTQSPTAFDLVYSNDGENWTTQESFTSPATWTASLGRTFAVTQPATARRRQLLN